MAVKKKAKSKTKPKKARAKKRTTKKKAAKKKKVTRRPKATKKRPVTKKKPRRKPKALKKKPAVRKPAARKPMPPERPAAPLPSAGEEHVGVVTHFYTHLSVAIIQMESGTLREGDTIHIKGHTSDFRQRVESMEINYVHVPQVTAGQVFGLRVTEHAREHDVVFKVVQ